MPDLLFERYNRSEAVRYAIKWALKRNPDYYNFDAIGGDCTNYASQCLYAGTGVMNFTPDTGWYYKNVNNRAPAWTSVNFLYNFLTGNKRAGPFGYEVSSDNVQAGDLVQLAINKPDFQHTPVITNVLGTDGIAGIIIAAHSYDCVNRPLSSYNFTKIRFIHIEGYRN